LGINLNSMKWLERHIYRIEVQLATSQIAHAAFGAAIMVDLQSRGIMDHSGSVEQAAPPAFLC
jgi:hypothetical protein